MSLHTIEVQKSSALGKVDPWKAIDQPCQFSFNISQIAEARAKAGTYLISQQEVQPCSN